MLLLRWKEKAINLLIRKDIGRIVQNVMDRLVQQTICLVLVDCGGLVMMMMMMLY